jgi:16S rRNA C967 or C1407 C5-methylase (RsmB/RsmF family)/NOL1/NOP2/fmu family ribosome biogenesis protein
MTNIPTSVISVLEELTGDSASRIKKSFDQTVRTSVRINSKKVLGKPDLPSIPWCDTGFSFLERPLFAFDPLFHTGAYYVQEASSMFLEQVLKQHVPLGEPLAVLDLCAAPGGKSTHLASLISEDSLLVSNEVIRSRANILHENLTKWGLPNKAIISKDPEQIGKSKIQFDVIVVDAPCSGEGLFRRDPSAIDHWSESNVELCAARQKRILADVWPALKPGGWLIYSTCTFNKLENEENLRWITEQMDATSLRLENIPEEIVETETNGAFGYRFLPNKVSSEGFFISIFRKHGDREDNAPSRIRKSKLQLPEELVLDSERFQIEKRGNELSAVPSGWLDFLGRLERLKPISVGVELGEYKGNNFRPDQAVANSTVPFSNYDEIKLTYEQALDFLSRNELKVKTSLGWKQMMFEGIPLGFVKSIGNRLNNNFKKEWRLRMNWQDRQDELFCINSLFK